MTAPIPREVLTLTSSLDKTAADFYLNYAWLARWSLQIATDAHLDMKALGQLVMYHCPRFCTTLAEVDFPNRFVVALETRFGLCDLEWPSRDEMVSDLLAIRDMAQEIAEYCAVNYPNGFGSVEAVEVNSAGRLVGTAVRSEKVDFAELVAKVQKLRALFG